MVRFREERYLGRDVGQVGDTQVGVIATSQKMRASV